MTWTGIAGAGEATRRSKADFYPTPDDVTLALLETGLVPKTAIIWECACGDGNMLRALKSSGYSAFGSEIRDGVDFLKIRAPIYNANYIITNPPFSLADEFIRNAADMEIPFAYLLKVQFWSAAKRYELFNEVPPTWVMPLTWRPDFLFGRGGGAPLMDVMWCVWEPGSKETRYRPLKRPERNKA